MTDIIVLTDAAMNKVYINPDNIISFNLVNDASCQSVKAEIILIDNNNKRVIEPTEEIEKRINDLKSANLGA